MSAMPPTKAITSLANGYNLNQVDPAVRLQLGQALNTPVANPYAGIVPGGLGAATITRERSLMPYPYYNAVNVRNPRLGNYMSHQFQLNIQKRMRGGVLFNVAYTDGKRMSDSALTPIDFGPIEQTNEGGFQNGLSTIASRTSPSTRPTCPSAWSPACCGSFRSVKAEDSTRRTPSSARSPAAGSST